MNSTISVLVDYGRISDDNLQALKQAYIDAISDMLSNGGKTVSSGNIGDLSFTFDGKSNMNISKWANYLKQAIAIIEGKPNGFTNRIQIKYR